MDGNWQYETGTYIADTVSYDNIEIIDNFEVKIRKSSNFDSFYLLGCYFGRLYLLEKQTLKYTEFSEIEVSGFIE